jgi:hypothetical protein
MSRPWNEEELGELLAILRPPPPAWTEAAAAIPALETAIEQLRLLGAADAELRADEIEQLETSLRAAGFEPTEALRRVVRRRLASES